MNLFEFLSRIQFLNDEMPSNAHSPSYTHSLAPFSKVAPASASPALEANYTAATIVLTILMGKS